MKITFLGTGAADWSFKDHGNLEGFRRNSSLLVDDCLLIDPGRDVPNALQVFGKRAEDIRYILNTHRHGDHYCQATVDALGGAEFRALAAGEEARLDRYTVTALAANHATCRGAVHFIVDDGERRLFYGLDGAWLLYDEVAAIKNGGVDLAVVDATVGERAGDYRIFEHNDLNMVLEMKASLEKYVKKFVISHMARTLHTAHGELADRMSAHGVEVAFDGLEIEL
ncbi:MAG: MBL fold metallo-hydrolase [Clostridia bacterium]|nr:MBL fold metallo-hydrolase [Clostridia bacterium]